MSETKEPESPKINPESLRSWEYEDFKAVIIGLYNSFFPNKPPIEDFDVYSNYVGGAGVISCRFPRRQDKEELLAYALDLAKSEEDVERAAAILSTAVVVTHPFSDGNGRVHRSLYSDLTGRERVDTTGRTQSFNTKARSVVDLGSGFTSPEPNRDATDSLKHFTQVTYPYKCAGLDYFQLRVQLHLAPPDSANEYSIEPEVRQGLEPMELVDLQDSIGEYKNDTGSLAFALRMAAKDKPDIFSMIDLSRSTEDYKIGLINVHEVLATLTVEQRKKFISDMWHYKMLVARAKIDIMAGVVKDRFEGGTFPAQDLAVQATNNYLSSNLD